VSVLRFAAIPQSLSDVSFECKAQPEALASFSDALVWQPVAFFRKTPPMMPQLSCRRQVRITSRQAPPIPSKMILGGGALFRTPQPRPMSLDTPVSA
jgi:hypothetical protein